MPTRPLLTAVILLTEQKVEVFQTSYDENKFVNYKDPKVTYDRKELVDIKEKTKN